MRCIICDKCGNPIENPKHCRVITCAKPLRLPTEYGCKSGYRGNDHQTNDILWEKELCNACAEDLDVFISPQKPPEKPQEPPAEGEKDHA